MRRRAASVLLTASTLVTSCNKNFDLDCNDAPARCTTGNSSGAETTTSGTTSSQGTGASGGVAPATSVGPGGGSGLSCDPALFATFAKYVAGTSCELECEFEPLGSVHPACRTRYFICSGQPYRYSPPDADCKGDPVCDTVVDGTNCPPIFAYCPSNAADEQCMCGKPCNKNNLGKVICNYTCDAIALAEGCPPEPPPLGAKCDVIATCTYGIPNHASGARCFRRACSNQVWVELNDDDCPGL